MEHAGIGSGESCLHQKDLGSRGVSIGRIEISDREPAFPRAKCATMSIGSASPSSTTNPRSRNVVRPAVRIGLARKGGTANPCPRRAIVHFTEVSSGLPLKIRYVVGHPSPRSLSTVSQLGGTPLSSHAGLRPTRPTLGISRGVMPQQPRPPRPRPGLLSGWELSTTRVKGARPPSEAVCPIPCCSYPRAVRLSVSTVQWTLGVRASYFVLQSIGGSTSTCVLPAAHG